jgi:hypothetical protein
MPTSFDHLVGAEQDRRCGSLNAKGLGSLEIHRHFKFCGPFNRKIGWFFNPLDAAIDH